MNKDTAPKSVASKLWSTLGIYGLIGLLSFVVAGRPVFVTALYLHTMTFVFLGIFLVASAGEVLFNKFEGDILLFRPVAVQTLLWAKISVLLQVSLWMAGAFNSLGFILGTAAPDGGWLFPLVHIVSVVMEALFCASCVVMVYQLCLKWFGRERLDTLMTTAQVLMTILMVGGSQLTPHLMGRPKEQLTGISGSWWATLVPPAWFAGLDDAVAGSGGTNAWILGGIGLAATSLMVWLAFVKLAKVYESGLQSMSETPVRRKVSSRPWLDRAVNTVPLRWLLRDSVTRASFLLVAAYLVRERDVKLRVFPALVPMLVFPIIFLVRDAKGGEGFVVAFASGYLGLIPLMALSLLQYSQNWQAADIFRAAPLPGPASLCRGARVAVLVVLTAPVLLIFAAIAFLIGHNAQHWPYLLVGLIALPVYAMIPHLGGKGVPLSLPMDESKAAGRGLTMIGVIFASAVLSGLSAAAGKMGVLIWFLLAEAMVAGSIYWFWRGRLQAARWPALE